jgi:adenylate cyclase
LFLVVAAFVAAHLCLWLMPGVFRPWNAQMIDRLYRLRYAVDHLRPTYNETIVHVDINNSAIQKLNNYYLNRSHYARVVRNLAEMGVAIQAFDFIFASRLNAQDDQALIDATGTAGTVYFGLAFLLSPNNPAGQMKSAVNEAVHQYLDRTKWPLDVIGDSSLLYFGKDPLPTFIPLASAAKGLGFINIKPDADGVFRRVPLLVKYADGCYPSFALRTVCDTLGVSPGKIVVTPGNSIILKDARQPGGVSHDVTIPIDDRGNMLVNFIGPWERMKHYNFAEIHDASETPDEMEIWTEELKGKIALISDVSTGSSDLGPVPTDQGFPLSGLHANAIHSMLTEEFLREAS